MKHIYPVLRLSTFVLIMVLASTRSDAQCPYGYIPDGVAFDTTVSTSPGFYSTQIKFPKFDPMQGMVTCMKLCVTITGIVNQITIENNAATTQAYDAYYIRNDNITGPGLSSPLTNSSFVHYGPYNLSATDGVTGSGPDYISIGPDTVLNAVSLCHTLTDSVSLIPFYGPAGDSLVYTYNIAASAYATGSGDFNSSVSTSAFVHFKLQYCYCPAWILPLSVHEFSINKIGTDKAELQWSGYDDPNANYHYEVETSRNGLNFTSIGSVAKITSGDNNIYKYIFAAGNNQKGKFFFRIKQVYSNGYTRFTDIKSVDLESSLFPKFSVYPNPSSGIIGIKFDNLSVGKYLVQITNSQGQTVVEKELELSGSSYRQIATLQSAGIYWLRLTDVTSHLSSVNQLFIK